jgi:hypothetical protein
MLEAGHLEPLGDRIDHAHFLLLRFFVLAPRFVP